MGTRDRVTVLRGPSPGNRTFVEWFVEFDCVPDDVGPWPGLLRTLIPVWVASLDRSLLSR